MKLAQTWNLEPWIIKKATNVPADLFLIRGQDRGPIIAAISVQANAERMVDSVNALKGIHVPSDFVIACRELYSTAFWAAKEMPIGTEIGFLLGQALIKVKNTGGF